MDIELITTKKKLTKTILDQIPFATIFDMEYALDVPDSIYGHVVTKKFNYSLFKGNAGKVVKKYLLVWEYSTNSKSLTIYSGNYSKTFESIEMRDRFIAANNELVRLAKMVQIYI